MNEDHYDGKCYACRKETKVRWKNLYTIGSEGTDLCLPCELEIVNDLRDKARDSMLMERDLRIKERDLKRYQNFLKKMKKETP